MKIIHDDVLEDSTMPGVGSVEDLKDLDKDLDDLFKDLSKNKLSKDDIIDQVGDGEEVTDVGLVNVILQRKKPPSPPPPPPGGAPQPPAGPKEKEVLPPGLDKYQPKPDKQYQEEGDDDKSGGGGGSSSSDVEDKEGKKDKDKDKEGKEGEGKEGEGKEGEGKEGRPGEEGESGEATKSKQVEIKVGSLVVTPDGSIGQVLSIDGEAVDLGEVVIEESTYYDNYMGLNVTSTGRSLGSFNIGDLKPYQPDKEGEGKEGEGKEGEGKEGEGKEGEGKEGEGKEGEGKEGEDKEGEVPGGVAPKQRSFDDFMKEIEEASVKTESGIDPNSDQSKEGKTPQKKDPNIVRPEDMDKNDKRRAGKEIKKSIEKGINSEAVKKAQEENQEAFDDYVQSVGIDQITKVFKPVNLNAWKRVVEKFLVKAFSIKAGVDPNQFNYRIEMLGVEIDLRCIDHIAVMIDVSVSMNDKFNEVIKHMAGLLAQAQLSGVNYHLFGWGVTDGPNVVAADELEKRYYRVRSVGDARNKLLTLGKNCDFGSTDFETGAFFVKNKLKGRKPDILFILTDGEFNCSSPSQEIISWIKKSNVCWAVTKGAQLNQILRYDPTCDKKADLRVMYGPRS